VQPSILSFFLSIRDLSHDGQFEECADLGFAGQGGTIRAEMVGKQLAHYNITAHLGSGGMGDVYQATDSKLGRSVAIKVLPTDFVNDSDRVARFEREARVLASLNHANIAAIYGFERTPDQHFLVMEFPGKRSPTGSSVAHFQSMRPWEL